MSRFIFLAGVAAALGMGPVVSVAQTSIRKQAVIDYTFDEPSGDVKDNATAGKVKDVGKLINGPRRVTSPFWNQRGKALQLNAARKQYVEVADSADTDRPNGVTVSFFYLNLSPANDAVTHGILAKRTDAGKRNTNYGINYIMKTDSIRPYINDGSGFRFPDFSAKQVLGTRRLVYLTATFEVGDAPGTDTDTDKDDVLMRLYVNGVQAQPKRRGVRVMIRRKDAWATDVNLKQLLNDISLTLGSTNTTIEHASGLLDEFTVFDRALKPNEVAALFREVAGPNAAQLAAEELKPPASPAPQITALSQHGLQIGQTTRLVISGQNLGENPTVRFPFAGVKQTIQKGSNGGRVVVDVAVPKTVAAAFYPLRVQTDNGLSKPVAVAIDHLPEHSAAGSSAQKPATLPAAFFGTLSGTQRAQIFFRGKAGQRIVADVEAKRLGATMDPVVEIKSARGTPLVIAWSKVFLKGDARAETTLPADGIYYVELHDLEFRAPGRNPFRLKIGDLKIVDAWFPTAVAAGTSTRVTPIGTGFSPNTSFLLELQETASTHVAGAGAKVPVVVPWHKLSTISEFVEPVSSPKQPPTVDATFISSESKSVAINGRLLKPEEVDRYLLNVKTGQRLEFTLLGRAIDSPIDAEVTVTALPQKTVIARGEDRPGSRDPKFAVNVPGGSKQLEVAVRDLFGRGGSHFHYRLFLSAVGVPDFRLAMTSGSLNLPANGSGVLQLQVTRSGYNGPIQLSAVGDDSLTFSPATIAAGRRGNVFVRVSRRGNATPADFQYIRIVGESTGVKPALRRTVTIADATQTIAGWDSELPLRAGQSALFSVKLAKLPPAIFKGARARIPVVVSRDEKLNGLTVRLSLISSEPIRPNDPKDPKKGNKPRVRSLPGQSIPPNESKGPLSVAAPLDVAANEIEFVLRADLVPHAYSSRIIATTFSEPFILPVKTAVALNLDAKSLTVRKTGTITGTIERTPGFISPVTLQLAGLPKGFVSKNVVVPAGKSTFAIPIGPAPKGVLPAPTGGKITLTVTDRFRSILLPTQNVALKFVAPNNAKKKPAARSKSK